MKKETAMSLYEDKVIARFWLSAFLRAKTFKYIGNTHLYIFQVRQYAFAVIQCPKHCLMTSDVSLQEDCKVWIVITCTSLKQVFRCLNKNSALATGVDKKDASYTTKPV